MVPRGVDGMIALGMMARFGMPEHVPVEVGLGTVCLQHGGNIWDREPVPPGASVRRGHYMVHGESDRWESLLGHDPWMVEMVGRLRSVKPVKPPLISWVVPRARSEERLVLSREAIESPSPIYNDKGWLAVDRIIDAIDAQELPDGWTREVIVVSMDRIEGMRLHLAGRGALTIYPDLDRPDDELCKSESDMMPGALAYARGDLVLPVDDPPGEGYAMRMIEAWRVDKARMDAESSEQGLVSGEDASEHSLETAKTPELAREAFEGG